MLLAADAPAEAPAATTYTVPANVPGYIKKAVENPARSAEQKARDANRKPAEVLALSGVKPGDQVVEFASFGQYFTTLLSDIVGPKGKIYMYDLPYTEQRAGAASRAFVESHPNSKYELVDYNKLELPQNVDIVCNVLYYHDLPLNDIDTASLNSRIFKALKPRRHLLHRGSQCRAGLGYARHEGAPSHRSGGDQKGSDGGGLRARRREQAARACRRRSHQDGVHRRARAA